ncbi:NmrA family NAD(P)-binding protein [Candidatus Frankia alpina]|nr:NmrA family NAD(P)-binding protein [Candidatus Frankia alpina]
MLVVTGATGQLGRLVVRHLLQRVPADHDIPDSLSGAFSAGDRVLLISGNEFGRRLAQHTAVISAARTAGVGLLAYTGILGGAATRFVVADDHHATEKAIEDSGLPYTFLRNGWYTENYTGQLPGVLASGAIIGTADPDSRIATATRDDYAEAAAAVLAGEDHGNTTYELSGDTAWSLREYAAEISRQSGTQVVYQQLAVDDYRKNLADAGLPEAMLSVFTDTEDAIARGELAGTSGDLSRLIGHPTTPLAATITAALNA